MNPDDLKYSKEHEWVRIEADGLAVVGITEYAAENLGDVVYVGLPEEGADVAQAAMMGEIESVKAVSDLYSPVSGRVVERNQGAVDGPETVNESPFGTGWLVKIELSNPSELESLMNAQEYDAFLSSQDD